MVDDGRKAAQEDQMIYERKIVLKILKIRNINESIVFHTHSLISLISGILPLKKEND